MLQSDETALLPLNCYFYVCYLRKIKSSQMLERNTQSTRNCLHGKKCRSSAGLAVGSAFIHLLLLGLEEEIDSRMMLEGRRRRRFSLFGRTLHTDFWRCLPF